MLVRFNTDQGHSTLRELRQTVQEMQTQATTVRTAVDKLTPGAWEAPAATQFLDQVVAWHTGLNRVLESMAQLNNRLEAEIAEWEETGRLFGQGSSAGTPPTPVPGPAPTPTPSPGAIPAPQSPNGGQTPTYNGSQPAPGTTGKPWLPTAPPLQGDPSNRNPALYNNVLNQFAVETNPRYKANQQGKGETYCNIFVWDVTRAMGAEVPHWVNSNGDSTGVGKGRELDANQSIRWLQTEGAERGWRAVSSEEAQAMANQGQPVIASWYNPGGIGHVAMVRPGEYSGNKGPAIAQAGGRNVNNSHVADTFGSGWQKKQVVYYVHS